MAATSYHISPNGPRLCKAEKGLCPYGRAGDKHFDNINDAEADYAARMESAFGTFPPMHERGTAYNARMNAYSYREDVVEAVEHARQTYAETRQALVDTKSMLAASAPVQNTLRVLRGLRNVPTRAGLAVGSFEARMAERSRTAPERRAAQAERVKAKANQVWAQTRANVAAMPGDVAETYGMLKQAARSARPDPTPRPRTPKAEGLQVGDYLEGGLRVARIETDEDGTVKARLRSPAGTWAGMRTYEANERVAVKRWSKRDLRNQAAGRSVPLRDRAFFQNVKAAGATQREVFRALRGVEAARSMASAPVSEDARVKPLSPVLASATAPALGGQAQALNTLAGISAQRKTRVA